MSAYICNPSHFGILAAYAVLRDAAVYEWQHTRANTLAARIDTAQRVAKGLARENIRSVKRRYPDCTDDDLPGPNLTPADIEEAAAIYAGHFVKHGNAKKLRPVDVLKLSQGLDYQSCETDDWHDTLAARQLRWIDSAAIRQIPGYEAADWSFETRLPEIEALYAKEST